MDRKEDLVLAISTSEVVQLRLGLIGLTKENWTQELLAVILLGILRISPSFKFYDPTSRSFFETENARFLEDVEFEGKIE